MDSNDVEIKDGFAKTRRHGRIHYRELGRGEPLILMHTNGGSAFQMYDEPAVFAKVVTDFCVENAKAT